jgi:ubiquinone/menaquinone biosynthesis C-methylase UbiE
MRHISLLLFAVFLLFNVMAYCQDAEKESTKFCGFAHKDTSYLRSDYGLKLTFLAINNGDTIVDVGSSSGNFIGALNVIGDFKNVHFVMVDIDSNCLNPSKVKGMWHHYEALKSTPFKNSYSIVNNNPDSLWLPVNRYRKFWIINTLHEIDDKKAIARQMAAILQPGGELVVGELLPAKRTMHRGCKKPLLTELEIKNIFESSGFQFKEMANLQVPREKDKHPYCFFKFIKE